MTILVAYVPRPEGQAALDKGIEVATRRNERLVVVNASPGGSKEDPSLADVQDYERVQQILNDCGIDTELKQYVRGKNAVEEIEALVESLGAWPRNCFFRFPARCLPSRLPARTNPRSCRRHQCRCAPRRVLWVALAWS